MDPDTAARRRKINSWIYGIGGGALLLLLMIVIVGAIAGGENDSADPAVATADSTSTAAPADQAIDQRADSIPADAQEAVVQRIVDGDTLEITAVAAGSVLDSTSRVDVRLLEINTPETKHPDKPVQCFGEQAQAELTRLAAPESTVWVQRDEELTDQYDRHLLYLWNSDGEFINEALVAGGYAEAKLYPPNDKHWPQISGAQEQAQQAGAGLWGACAHFGAPAEPVEPARNEPTPAPAPQPAPEPHPQPAPAPDPAPGHPQQRMGADTDCSDYSSPVIVAPGDPHRLDADGDGIGCEAS